MKRIILLAALLSLALAACAGGRAVGDQGLVDIEETNRVSPSPTPTNTPTKRATRSATPQPTKSEQPKQSLCPAGGEIEIRIRTLGDGFEWREKGKGNYRSVAGQPPRVLQGCEVLFRNDDPDRKHSWVSGDAGTESAAKYWESPALATGKTWILDTAKVPAGYHTCHDGEVPYIVGCGIDIVPRSS